MRNQWRISGSCALEDESRHRAHDIARELASEDIAPAASNILDVEDRRPPRGRAEFAALGIAYHPRGSLQASRKT